MRKSLPCRRPARKAGVPPRSGPRPPRIPVPAALVRACRPGPAFATRPAVAVRPVTPIRHSGEGVLPAPTGSTDPAGNFCLRRSATFMGECQTLDVIFVSTRRMSGNGTWLG